MESWNVDLKDSISSQIDDFIFIPNIPPFHHSNIPAGSQHL
jgi:hypothetical protein